MRLIVVLGIFVGIPAFFILADINNKPHAEPHTVAIATPKYAEESIEKCFFWITDDEMEVPLQNLSPKKMK